MPEGIECGRGECRRLGVTRCEAGQVVNGCQPGDSGAEMWDGLDNNCDGETDEGCQCTPATFVPEGIECGRGECRRLGVTR